MPIEQAAKAGGAAAGAAYVVSRGSYYLSRNIVLNGSHLNAVNVSGNSVTIDFRGFSIIGRNSAGGTGISAPGQTNVTIQNGNIQGMGGGGITLGSGTVRSMRITGGGAGIACTGSCLIEDNAVIGTSGDGISAAGLIEHNVSDGNSGSGITAGANSSIIGNEVSGNSGTGIAMQAGDGFSNNVIKGTTTTSGGVDAGNNVCNGSTTCP